MGSPFFQLPGELRDEIYGLVFGHRTIHVQSEYFENSNLRGDPTVYTDVLGYNSCWEIVSEEQAYLDSQYFNLDDPYGLRPHCKGAPKLCRYCKRHQICWDVIRKGSAGTLDCKYCKEYGRCLRINTGGGGAWNLNHRKFAVLQTCKTIHREAMPVLFAFTTFSFDLAYTLSTFVTGLNPWRRHLVRNIRLCIVKDFPPYPWIWENDNVRYTIQLLTGLRSLHIHILQKTFIPRELLNRPECWHEALIPPFGVYIDSFREGTIPWWEDEIELFRSPKLNEVIVTIDDDVTAPIYGVHHTFEQREMFMRWCHLWTMEERAQWARLLRGKLLEG